MGIVTILVIGAVVHIFLKKMTMISRYKSLLILAATVEVLNFRGGIVSFGEFSIGFNYFVEFVLTLYTVWFVYRNRIAFEKKVFYCGLFVFSLCVLSLVQEVVFPYPYPIMSTDNPLQWDGYFAGLTGKGGVVVLPGRTTMLFSKVLMFCFQAIFIKSVLRMEDLYDVLRAMTRWVWIVVIYGFYEAFVRYILSSDSIIYATDLILFGSLRENAGVLQSLFSDSLIRLSGLEAEPSYFVNTLFLLVVFMLLANRACEKSNAGQEKKPYSVLSFLLVLLLIILSGAFSSIWVLGMLVPIRYFINRRQVQIPLRSVMAAFLVIGLVLSSVYGILNWAAENGEGYWKERAYQTVTVVSFLADPNSPLPEMSSSFARLGSISDVSFDVMNRPLLGLGLGVQNAHSGLLTILSYIGFLGLGSIILLLASGGTYRRHYDIPFILFYFFVFNIVSGLMVYPYEVHGILLFEFTAFYCTKWNEASAC